MKRIWILVLLNMGIILFLMLLGCSPEEESDNNPSGSVNTPPEIPSGPIPENLVHNVDTLLTEFSWICSDQDDDDLSYSLYMDTSETFAENPILTNTEYFAAYDLKSSTHYYWKVVARDQADSTSGPVWEFYTQGQESGEPPLVPSNPTPSDGATGVDPDTMTFAWTGGDPDSDQLYYGIYLATESDFSNSYYLRGQPDSTSFEYYSLSPNQTYYWRVDVQDEIYNYTEGPIWSFTTGESSGGGVNSPPNLPANPSPGNMASEVDTVDLVLTWECDDPDAGDTLTYDVFWGLSSEEWSDSSLGLTSEVCIIEELESATSYYWQVVAYDNHGASSDGGIWIFETAEPAVPDLIEWERTFDNTGSDSAAFLEITSDGGYLLTGTTDDSWPNRDVLMIKTDAMGNEIWSRTHGGNYDEQAWSGRETSDGGFIIGGTSSSFDPCGKAYLLKTNSIGSMEWQETYCDYEYLYDHGTGAVETMDGGFAILGYGPFNNPDAGIYLIRTNDQGNQDWFQTYEPYYDLVSTYIERTLDGGYIMTGQRYINSSPSTISIFLVKADADGNHQWTRTFTHSDDCRATCVKQTSDGGYIISGRTYIDWKFSALLIKTNSNGIEEWSNAYRFEYQYQYFALSVTETFNGNYMVAGSQANNYPYLLKVGPDGEELWSDVIYDNYNYHLESIQQASDGGFAIAGWFWNTAGGDRDVYLMKISNP